MNALDGFVLGAFFTWDTLKLNLEPAGDGEVVNVNTTFNWFDEGEVQVTAERRLPAVHVGEEGRVISEGKVMKKTSVEIKSTVGFTSMV